MTAVNFIDTTGLEMLHRLNDRLDKAGVALHLCEAKGPVRDQLAHIAPADWLTGPNVFGTTDEAFTPSASPPGAAPRATPRRLT